MRCGVLPALAGLCVNYVLQHSPIVFDLGTWYAGCTATTVALLVAFALYAFALSPGGRPLLGEKFFQEG